MIFLGVTWNIIFQVGYLYISKFYLFIFAMIYFIRSGIASSSPFCFANQFNFITDSLPLAKFLFAPNKLVDCVYTTRLIFSVDTSKKFP